MFLLGMAASTSRWIVSPRFFRSSIVTLIANLPLLLWAAVRRLQIQNSFALSTLAGTGRQAIGKRDNQSLMKRVSSSKGERNSHAHSLALTALRSSPP